MDKCRLDQLHDDCSEGHIDPLAYRFHAQKRVANVTEEDVRTECEMAETPRMRYENAAVGAAWDEIGNALFPSDHPYARSTIGSHETLSNINLEAVQDL